MLVSALRVVALVGMVAAAVDMGEAVVDTVEVAVVVAVAVTSMYIFITWNIP